LIEAQHPTLARSQAESVFADQFMVCQNLQNAIRIVRSVAHGDFRVARTQWHT
jgi:hypothetical protein